MTGDFIDNPLVRRFLPPVAAVGFFSLFVSLGFWQLDRAGQKEALLAKFEVGGEYRAPHDFARLEEFERIAVTGRFRDDRQVLVDNIPIGGRVGYYVLTPFEPSTNDPLLLVNRGWVPKTGPSGPPPGLAIDDELRTIHGLAGRLPRVGIRPGSAFEGAGDWPRVAVYPTLDEVAAELGESLLPVVLLLQDPSAGRLVQEWEPRVSGPATHYGYAFQWFAMAATVAALAIWHTRKRRRRVQSE